MGGKLDALLREVSKKTLLFLIWFYKAAVSPHLPRACRFYPTCSTYAQEAVEKYGCIKGTLLAARRLLRCHPLKSGGFDPVP